MKAKNFPEREFTITVWCVRGQTIDLKTNTKPILYLFNQPWCGACNKLKEAFQKEGDSLVELSKQFVMVNVGGDDNNLFGVSLGG